MLEFIKSVIPLVSAGSIFTFILSSIIQPEGSSVSLTEEDNGKDVELSKGDTMFVTLPANLTTGYTWIAESFEPSILKPVGNPQFKPDSLNLGAGGSMKFQFEAVASGATSVSLFYRRRWEKDAQPSRTFHVEITVK